MSHRKKIDGVDTAVLIETPPAKCELCGDVAELRPYGPRGENICWACAEKNPEARDRQIARILFGIEIV
jgi:hypothetical protein